jgi:FKBP-type peptidyl-prolyl cis-trans isomerase (trigger factor)
MAGKTVQFKLTVITGSKTIPCALDDNLASKLGKASFSELKDYVNELSQVQVVNKFKLALTEAVAKRLVQDNHFNVPQWMALSEARYVAHTAKVNWDTLNDVDRTRYVEIATGNVKLSLILDKIRESEPDAQLTDQEVFDIIKRNLMNSKSGSSLEELLSQMNNSGYLQVLMSRVKDEHVLDYVLKNARVVE